MARSRSSRKNGLGTRLRGYFARVAAIAFLATVLYGGYLAWTATSEFEGRRWDIPAQVYATPLELYVGRALAAEDLVSELRRLGYREDPRLPGPGTYRLGLGRMELATRGFAFAGDTEAESLVSISFLDGRIAALRDASGRAAPIVRLNPLLIGSLFPSHGEDRIIVTPEGIPPLLTSALKAVEDRRYDSHLGIDPIAVGRALLVNVSAGEIREGASTLTQQLVRSYFLSNERTWWRKLREAVMAVALELRYSKDELLHAYVNEIYLGQDGGRAVHGFGLASQFYFGKPPGATRSERASDVISCCSASRTKDSRPTMRCSRRRSAT
jgi:penicillin-binding protein 1B